MTRVVIPPEQADPIEVHRAIEDIYRKDSRQVLASLVRLLGDFDLAEEALQEAFQVALAQWPAKGLPHRPVSWLISTGRFKAIDATRRLARFAPLEEADSLSDLAQSDQEISDSEIEDDQLRLIFTCCHPALSSKAQIALTLREVCGLTTEELASAFLITPSTLAQRIVRAKAKIRDARIPIQLPTSADLPQRLGNVLRVLYLVFNEGLYPSSGVHRQRPLLTSEAIRLARLLYDRVKDSESAGLLALMLLHESRAPARQSGVGNIILLKDQDRSLWRQDLVSEGLSLVDEHIYVGKPGWYSIQAAIAAEHARAPTAEATDWKRIIGHYDRLMELDSSPVIELNRAAAISMVDGPASALEIVEQILNRGVLTTYAYIHAAKAEFLRQLGRISEAKRSYETSLSLVQLEPERRFLSMQLAGLSGSKAG